MNNDFFSHKKSDAIKWIVAFVLIAVLLAGVGISLFLTLRDRENDNPPIKQEQTNEAGGASDENGNELQSGKVYPMSSNMLFSSPSALSENASEGVTVVATVKPETAKDKTVDWTLAFVNSASEWATGKTVSDYLTVTPQSDGSTTATVVCKEAFGEPITVTCTSRQNSEATATMRVDYYNRLSALTCSSTYDGRVIGDNTQINWDFFGSSDSASLLLPTFKTIGTFGDCSYMYFNHNDPVLTWGVGTVKPTITSYKTYMQFHSEFVKAISSEGIIANSNWNLTSTNETQVIGLTPYALSRIEVCNGNTCNVYTMNDKTTFNKYMSALRRSDGKLGTLKVVVEYGNGFTYEQTCEVGFNEVSIGLMAEKIELSDSTLYM